MFSGSYVHVKYDVPIHAARDGKFMQLEMVKQFMQLEMVFMQLEMVKGNM